ncbi:MAG: hypothetical protein A2940_01530 [Candidatus Wildermuthbacteria bacterium RIFCSPLOWO2_01_FULL_48_29]|uniref:DUF86 domain-containing protein n=2 Tax=Candidatus Wildermuthiibacteriota TaxID=1817923 RepID=A0A1G2RNV7_9BACT|nr:MAG: hypothetical protein A2843_01820 [Candidatus Wildermuthbacteria bacterium RIFCSPHIGHO2_01_FULL_48_27b]OHA73711.1 MAG: hypothetical protein A2940_01530 [Candidatus Wildermuthbacteria bacterium RIFCSPLOWO2_01_FULL_48_29]
MEKPELEKDVIVKRIDGIQGEVEELRKLAQIPFEEFQAGVGFKLAHYHLHRALEGVFHIAAHILSRTPGGQAVEYKEIARKLGEYGIVEKEFADTKLVEMARYRNRLVHFYAEITAEELHEILQKDLEDFGIFLSAIKKLL